MFLCASRLSMPQKTNNVSRFSPHCGWLCACVFVYELFIWNVEMSELLKLHKRKNVYGFNFLCIWVIFWWNFYFDIPWIQMNSNWIYLLFKWWSMQMCRIIVLNNSPCLQHTFGLAAFSKQTYSEKIKSLSKCPRTVIPRCVSWSLVVLLCHSLIFKLRLLERGVI